MKKILLSITCLTGFLSYSQNVAFNDPALKTALLSINAINTNADSEIQLTEANTYNGAINITNNNNITDLTGIEEFTGATLIDFQFCSGINTCPKITSTALTQLVFWSNQLTSIDLSGLPNLKIFRAIDNQLTSLDLSNNTNLENIRINRNQIDSLDFSNNTKLMEVEAKENSLVFVDLSTNTTLKTGYFGDNNLSTIDLTNLTSLTTLSLDKNPIANVNLANNLLLSYYSANEILATSIDLSDLDSLERINLADLPNLSSLNIANGNNTKLITAFMTGNPNLSCIEVDDTTYAISNSQFIFRKDANARFSLNCSATTSINEGSISGLLLFPNPSSDFIQITNLDKQVDYMIYSALGQKVCFGTATNNQKIAISNLKNGLYFLILAGKSPIKFTKK